MMMLLVFARIVRLAKSVPKPQSYGITALFPFNERKA